MYYQSIAAPLVAFPLSNGAFTGAHRSSSVKIGYPGGCPIASSNGSTNGLIWVVDASQYATAGPAQLYAYNATNIQNPVYSSVTIPNRDVMGPAVKFVTPLVQSGKVYVGTGNAVAVFGLGTWAQNPVIETTGGNYSSPVSVTVSESTPGAKLYYTLDGSVPTPHATPYSGPITISSNATLSVRAYVSGMNPSGYTVAYYQINPTVGDGNGLSGAYYSNVNFSGLPISESDPDINFNWNGAPPIAGIPGKYWSATWTGTILPYETGGYTFSTFSSDGVLVYIDGHLVINDWTHHSPQWDTGTPINLSGGSKHTISIKYYAGSSSSILELYWQSKGLQKQIVPQTQLYSD
jgi:hypothetical protein